MRLTQWSTPQTDLHLPKIKPLSLIFKNSNIEIFFTYHIIHPFQVNNLVVFSVHSSATITIINFRTFSPSLQKNLVSIAVTPHFLSTLVPSFCTQSWPSNHSCTLYLYRFAILFLQMQSYNM